MFQDFNCTITDAAHTGKVVHREGSDAVSKQMSDKLQFVAQSDKLKHVGHQTALTLFPALRRMNLLMTTIVKRTVRISVL